MTLTAKEKLLLIGEVLGTDAYLALKTWALFEDFEKLAADGNDNAKKIIDALDLVHKTVAIASSKKFNEG